MRFNMKYLLLVFFILFCWTSSPSARDMRALQTEARETREALAQRAAAEKAEAEAEAAESREKMLADRAALETAISNLAAKNKTLSGEVSRLSDEKKHLDETAITLSGEISRTDAVVKELVGVIRINAKDIDTLLSRSLQTVSDADGHTFLPGIADETRFPGMDDVRDMVDALIDLMDVSGAVTLRRGPIVDRRGRDVTAELLFVGPFTALYRTDEETGFLNYVTADGRLYALSHLPSGGMQKQISRYMDGKSDAVPMDISAGGALQQLTHSLSLLGQIPSGGPIVWPILAVLAAGILIIIERIVFLVRKGMNSDRFMERIERRCIESDWDAGNGICRDFSKKPLARVLQAGLEHFRLEREEMENALQEAILKEIPPMERFLSTLGMLAAIAPLLGLLGTVTGMIDTFHVITLHGTGDARLMSGGISEALVTTMLGLSVAIPLMLAQTLLNRAVDKNIGQMEEKAVTLVNIIHKHREQC